jgi:hypothetical protein
LMSYIAHMIHISWLGRRGHLGGLIPRCDRIGCSVFFCLERGTSDIRVLRLGLGGEVVSIWRFDRSGSLSSDAPKFVKCFNGLIAHGVEHCCKHDLLHFALIVERHVPFFWFVGPYTSDLGIVPKVVHPP